MRYKIIKGGLYQRKGAKTRVIVMSDEAVYDEGKESQVLYRTADKNDVEYGMCPKDAFCERFLIL